MITQSLKKLVQGSFDQKQYIHFAVKNSNRHNLSSHWNQPKKMVFKTHFKIIGQIPSIFSWTRRNGSILSTFLAKRSAEPDKVSLWKRKQLSTKQQQVRIDVLSSWEYAGGNVELHLTAPSKHNNLFRAKYPMKSYFPNIILTDLLY